MIPIPLYGVPSRITQRLYPWTIITAITGVTTPKGDTLPVSMFAGLSSRLLSPDLADTEEKKAALEKIQKLTSMLPEKIHPLIPGLHDPDVTFTVEVSYHMPALPGLWGRKTSGVILDTPLWSGPRISTTRLTDGVYAFSVAEYARERRTNPSTKRERVSLLDLRPYADFMFFHTITGKTKLSRLLTPEGNWDLNFAHATWTGSVPTILARDSAGTLRVPELNNIHSDGRLCTGSMSVNTVQMLTLTRGNLISALSVWMEAYFNQKPNSDLMTCNTHDLFKNLSLSGDGVTFTPHNGEMVQKIVGAWRESRDVKGAEYGHLPPLAIAI